MINTSNVVKAYEVTFVHISTKEVKKQTDYVAIEEPLQIFVNNKHYATILCSPMEKEVLVVGNIFSEGLVNSLDDVLEIRPGTNGEFYVTLREDIDVSKRMETLSFFKRFILTSSNATDIWSMSKLIDWIQVPRVSDTTLFDADVISKGTKRLNDLASIFRKTGGVHAAAVFCSQGELLALAEDVGRHNAVDKALGKVILQKQASKGKFLALTGRMTGDIVLKAARLRIPLVVSISAGINSGIDIAEKTGITLVGFARGDRMNIYTFPERLVP
ncbi:MAG: formate dehydrogenase accessory sulfurtransferase FdhD [Candidatus Bathyarchaeia archaeon]